MTLPGNYSHANLVSVGADGRLVALAVHSENDGAATPFWLHHFTRIG